jgi:hypothetical protein
MNPVHIFHKISLATVSIIPIYTYIFLVVFFLKTFLPKLCIHFSHIHGTCPAISSCIFSLYYEDPWLSCNPYVDENTSELTSYTSMS